MRLVSSLVILTTFATLATGCVIDKGDDDDDGSGDHAGDSGDSGDSDDAPGPDGGSVTPDSPPSSADSVAPGAGTWFYAQVHQTASNCGSRIGATPAGDFTIANVTSSAFHVIASDGAFDCTYSASGFDCPNRAFATQDLHPQFDAVITGHGTAAGTFDLATHGSGSQTGTFTCAGADCATLAAATGATIPCTATVSFVIARH